MYFSEAEHADVLAAAERMGMRPGALIGELAVRYARGVLDPPPADMRAVVAEVMAQRPYLTRVGTLLNQIAKHANAQGELPADAGEQLAVVRRLVETLSEQVDAQESQAVARQKASRT
ncbi:MobC domain-containing protein [Salinifilum ghardaiensis]